MSIYAALKLHAPRSQSDSPQCQPQIPLGLQTTCAPISLAPACSKHSEVYTCFKVSSISTWTSWPHLWNIAARGLIITTSQGTPYHPMVFHLRNVARNAQNEHTASYAKQQVFFAELQEAYRIWLATCNPTQQETVDGDLTLPPHCRVFMYAVNHMTFTWLLSPPAVSEYIPLCMLGCRMQLLNLLQSIAPPWTNWTSKTLGGKMWELIRAFVWVIAETEGSYSA